MALTVYEGNKPYIFISYAHKDSDTVLPIIESLTASGFRVWYDAGIEAGTEWPEYIADKLSESACVIAFISKAALASQNCRREINYAISENKEMLSVYLEDVELSKGMAMQLGTTQAMFFTRSPWEAFIKELVSAPILAPCRGDAKVVIAKPPKSPLLIFPQKKWGKKKRCILIGAIVFAVTIFILILGISVYQSKTPSEGLSFEFSTENAGYAVTGIGVCTDIDIIIPQTYNGVPVTAIRVDAFSNCTSLTSVTIPASVTSISESAFSNCTSLTNVMIPDSVTSIGSEAFYGCTSLTSITIPDSVTSIGDYVFSDCNSLKSVTISDKITSIGVRMFDGCTSLTSITIPNSVTSIGVRAFEGCGSLESVTIPDSVTSIGEHAFYGCTSLTSITIPNSVTSFGSKAFYGCTSLTSITIPDSVTSIGSEAFCGCTSLTSITIPDSVTSIGNMAFYGCTSLTSITIPDSVTSVGDGTFHSCTSLTRITIPDNMTRIAPYMFYGCSNLTRITIPDSVFSMGYMAFKDCSNLTIYCEAASKPSGWDSSWNPDNRPVVWSYTGE